jgi:hypothetical protein
MRETGQLGTGTRIDKVTGSGAVTTSNPAAATHARWRWPSDPERRDHAVAQELDDRTGVILDDRN